MSARLGQGEAERLQQGSQQFFWWLKEKVLGRSCVVCVAPVSRAVWLRFHFLPSRGSVALRALLSPVCGERGGGHAHTLPLGPGRKSRPPALCPRPPPLRRPGGLGHPGRGDRAAAVCGERRQPAMVSGEGETDFHGRSAGSTLCVVNIVMNLVIIIFRLFKES